MTVTWLDRPTRLLVRRRALFAALFLLLTAGSLVAASRVKVQASIEAWFLEDDASLARYHAFRRAYGSDEFVVVAAFGPGVKTPAGLDLVERIRRGAAALPETHRTRWLTSADVVLDQGDDVIGVGPLAPRLPTDQAGVDALWARAASLRAAKGLVATGQDGTPATAVLVELRREAQTIDGKRALMAGLRAVLAREGASAMQGVEVVISGPPAFDDAFVAHTERDFAALGPIGLLLIVGVIWLAVRRVSLTLVPVGVVVAAICWTLGGMGLTGFEVGITSSNLICVVLAIGVADAIHLVNEFRAHVDRGASRDDAIAGAVADVFVPCVFTCLTTIVGMLSLCTSAILPIREFGVLAAAGVTLAWLATFTLGPVLLSFCRVEPAARGSSQRGPEPRPGTPRPHWAARIGRFGPRGRAVVLSGAALLVVASLAAATRLQVGVNPVEYFRRDDPTRRATERVDAAMGGTACIELSLRAPGAGLEDPARLAALDALRAALERERGASYSQSVLDPLVDMHRAFTGDPAAGLPDSRDLAAQYYLLLESDEQLPRLLRPDHASGRLSLRTQMSMTDRPLEVISRIEARAKEPALAAAGLEVEVTGYVHLMATMYDYLLRSQIESILLAFLTVTPCMVVLVRSLRLGLVSMIPNVMPLVVGAGLMGLLGIRLDVGTVMIASIVLGLVVDDTTHLLARFKVNLAAHPDLPVDEVVARTLGELGGAVVTTSLALAVGFGALAFGSFLVNVYFGLICAVVIVIALVADLVLTPTLVVVLAPWILPGRSHLHVEPPAVHEGHEPPPHGEVARRVEHGRELAAGAARE